MTGSEPGGLTVRDDGLGEAVAALEAGDDDGGLVLVVGRSDAPADRLAAGAGTAVTGTSPAVRRLEPWARERVATVRGERVTVLSPTVRVRVVRAALRAATEGPVARLADRTAAGDEPDAAAVARELEDYHRCTDAASDAGHDALLDAVAAVAETRPFAASVTGESVAAFRELDGRLRRVVAEGDGDADRDGRTFVSRSHLLGAAREAGLGRDRPWVLVAPRAPVDAAVLRTVVALADEAAVHLLGDDRLAERAAAVADRSGVDCRRAETEPPDSEAARRVRAALRGRATTAADVQAVAAPDRRREVERAVRAAGRSGRTLLVAPDPEAYAPALRDVTLTADRPGRVGTARPLDRLPTARALSATVSLVVAAEGGEVAAETVIDPLRLGAVPPGASGEWPLSLAAVDDLRERLPGSASLAAHREAVAASDATGAGEFLDWVARVTNDPPASGREVRTTLVTAVDAHARAIRRDPRRRVEGIAVETDRALALAEHPAGGATRVREAVDRRVEGAYDRLLALDGEGWATARTALRAALSAERHPPRTDADAVELLPIGDPAVSAAPVDHLVVLGLSAESFPRPAPRATLLHAAVREAVARGAAGPAAHLDGETDRYRHDRAALGRALRAVAPDGRVTLSRPYKDEEGRDVPPSPTLDALSVPERERERIALDEWSHDGVAGDGPPTPKDRLRALARGVGGADRDRLAALAAGTGPEDARRVLRRVQRFEERLEDGDER